MSSRKLRLDLMPSGELAARMGNCVKNCFPRRTFIAEKRSGADQHPASVSDRLVPCQATAGASRASKARRQPVLPRLNNLTALDRGTRNAGVDYCCMMPDIVNRMPSRTRNTFNLAYDNSKKRPIGWWEPDKDAVGLVQAWLLALGESMAKSASFELDDDTITSDGIFGEETFRAVQSFQRKNHLTADGMVGHDTLDALREALKKKVFVPPVQTTTEVIIEGTPPRPCPPGALICPDRF